MRKLCLIALVLWSCGGGDDGGDGPPGPGEGVALTVMTRNLYLGADLLPVVTAPTVAEIPGRVSALWKDVLDSDPDARIQALADEIAAAAPDVVGLQEVALFRFQEKSNFDFGAPALDAQEARFDFLKALRAALEARGASYQEPVVLDNADVELPGGPAGERFDVRLTDRDAILVKAGLTVHARQAMQFPSKLTFPLPLADPAGGSKVQATLVRGYTLAELEKDGARFTFVNTHLEVGGGGEAAMAAAGAANPAAVLATLQENQARDLMTVIKGRAGPLVAVGDYNSPPDGRGTKSYGIVAAELTDAWTKVAAGDPGHTCCSGLRSDTFNARGRIDLVFYRGAIAVDGAQVVGTDPAKKARGGLWPSDHAGVVARLRVAAR